MEISFVGAGGLAWHLAPSLEAVGYRINEVYSRQLTHARQLVHLLYDAQPQSTLNFADSPSTLFFLAVPDDALSDVCARLVLPDGATVVHTSGSRSLADLRQWMDVFSDVPVHVGVFYPLQTFTRGQEPLDLSETPVCVEAEDAETETKLLNLAESLSTTVQLLNSEKRRALHLAAVFACNFTNYVLGAAHDLTSRNDVDFTLLKPLLRETIRKALTATHPADVQTGPARRGDNQIMALHLEMLADQPMLSAVYDLLSDAIQVRGSP